MGMWYPANEDRRMRALQLVTENNSFKANVNDQFKASQNLRKDILEDIDDGLKKRGFPTVTALMAQYQKEWSEKDKEYYTGLVKHYGSVEETLETEIKIVGYVASAAGFIGGVSKVALILEQGKIATGFKCLGEGLLRLINKETEAATRLLNVATTVLQDTFKALEIPEGAVKVLKAIKFISKAVGAVAVVLDGILIGFDLYSEHEQREELIKVIHDLDVRRFVACTVDKMYVSYKEYIDCIYNITSDLAVSEKPDEKTKNRIKKQIDRMAKSAKDVTFDAVWDKLKARDDNDHAYLDDDYKKPDIEKLYMSNDPRFEFRLPPQPDKKDKGHSH